MYHVLCQVSGTSGFTEDPSKAYDALACPENSACCKSDHDCGEAANACPGGHPDGRCGYGVDGCTVCHPLTITVIPGSVNLSMAGA